MAQFVDPSPPTSACHLSNFLEPKSFTASVRADHPVFPHPAPCWCPAVSAAIVPVTTPHSFPPPIVFCRIGFSPISTLCSDLVFFPAFCLFPSSGNVVACLINHPALPTQIPSILGADVGSFSFPLPWFPLTGFLAGCLRIPAAYSSSSSSSGSFDSPVSYPASSLLRIVSIPKINKWSSIHHSIMRELSVCLSICTKNASEASNLIKWAQRWCVLPSTARMCFAKLSEEVYCEQSEQGTIPSKAGRILRAKREILPLSAARRVLRAKWCCVL